MIVVGAGAGGATVAAQVTAAGLSVLLLERGPRVDPRQVPRDHLRNHVSARYRNVLNPPPGAHPRVLEEADGTVKVVEPPDWAHNNTANVVGGGTLVWGMQAWRLHPDDFRMASRYCIPDGSSLADWPLTYEELEPYYTRAEQELGVAGDERDSHAPRSGQYPMPARAPSAVDRWLSAGAARKGWSTQRVPLAVNTQPHDGRSACMACRACIGFPCPVDAKNGAHNTVVPRALATGLCELVPRAQVTQVRVNSRGTAVGVEYVADGNDGGMIRRTARARAVILAAGAIETARLLLVSRSRHHPTGLGNQSDHVGRHLQGHTYAIAVGILPDDVPNFNRGPGPGVATTDCVHGNPGVIGGAMLANDFVKPPLSFWEMMLPPGTPRWGLANKRTMRELFGRVIDVRGAVQEIPSPDSRARLDAGVRDRLGVPVVRLSGGLHPETIRTAKFISEQAHEWLRTSGATRVWSLPLRTGLAVAHHQAGTARMSADPRDGVTGTTGRVHGHENLFVADAAVHVTNGAFNPALTVFALALRTGEEVVASLA